MPSPGDLLEFWDRILSEGYDEVVYIPMSSGLSNSCAAEAVFTAAALSKEGRSGKEIKEYLENNAYNASIYVTVNTLEYLKRGGCVTPAKAALAAAFNIKPIHHFKGKNLILLQKRGE